MRADMYENANVRRTVGMGALGAAHPQPDPDIPTHLVPRVLWNSKIPYRHMVRHPRCVFMNYNWINQLSNTTIWWLDICCLLHRYELHVSALMAILRLMD